MNDDEYRKQVNATLNRSPKPPYNPHLQSTSQKVKRFLTRTPPSFLALFWPTISAIMMYLSNVSLALKVYGFCIGIMLYTALEYSFHGWLLHKLPLLLFRSGRPYYYLHGKHHVDSSDHSRNVFPLSVFLPVFILYYNLLSIFVERQFLNALTSGIIIGYCLFEATHYYSHCNWSFWLLDPAREYHMQHHNVSKYTCYSFVSPYFDWVFGTLPKKEKGVWRKVIMYFPLPIPFIHFMIYAVIRRFGPKQK